MLENPFTIRTAIILAHMFGVALLSGGLAWWITKRKWRRIAREAIGRAAAVQQICLDEREAQKNRRVRRARERREAGKPR